MTTDDKRALLLAFMKWHRHDFNQRRAAKLKWRAARDKWFKDGGPRPPELDEGPERNFRNLMPRQAVDDFLAQHEGEPAELHVSDATVDKLKAVQRRIEEGHLTRTPEIEADAPHEGERPQTGGPIPPCADLVVVFDDKTAEKRSDEEIAEFTRRLAEVAAPYGYDRHMWGTREQVMAAFRRQVREAKP